MKVYVDELPSCCEDCVCHNGVSGRCKLLHRTTFDIPPRDCPLQSLSDYTKQVRKEVCEEITKFFRNNFTAEINKKGNFLIRVENEKLNKLLEQIQGE